MPAQSQAQQKFMDKEMKRRGLEEGGMRESQMIKLREYIRRQVTEVLQERKLREAGNIANFKGKQAAPFGKKKDESVVTEKKAKLGSKNRFKNLAKSLAAKEGVDLNDDDYKELDEQKLYNPMALAAWIGRKKHGK